MKKAYIKTGSRFSLVVTIALIFFLTVVSGSAVAEVESAERTIEKSQVELGNSINVSIEVSVEGETAPKINEGISVNGNDISEDRITVSSKPSGAFVVKKPGTIGMVWIGDSTTDDVKLEYLVKIPENSDKGEDYNFSGSAEDNNSVSITGDNKVSTIESKNINSAKREISNVEPLAGETVEISTTVEFESETEDARIEEKISPPLPDGNVDIVSDSNATVTEYRSSDGTLGGSWGSTKSLELRYALTIPSDTPGGTTYEIVESSAVDESNGETTDITGPSKITISKKVRAAGGVEIPSKYVTNNEQPTEGDSEQSKNASVEFNGLSKAAADFRENEAGFGLLSDVAKAFRKS